MIEPIIRMVDIVKEFPGVVANDSVTLEVFPQEVHALLGENGAGKSTLMKILYGLYRPDSGEIYIRNKKVVIHSSKDSLQLGIGMVHQHFQLIEPFTVIENIILGLRTPGYPLLNPDRIRREIEELAKQYVFTPSLDTSVGELSVRDKQKVEIMKAVYRKADILILDEPTALLTPQGVESLFRDIRSIIEAGRTVILIEHKLEEILAISHRISVLRRGKMVGTIPRNEASKNRLAEMMVGREVVLDIKAPSQERKGVVLALKDVTVIKPGLPPSVEDFSLNIHGGEIVGLAGISGNGQRELVQSIVGLQPVRSGAIRLAGQDVTGQDIKDRANFGLGYIPEDRLNEGIIPNFSVSDNLILGLQDQPEFQKRKLIRKNKVNRNADNNIREFAIQTTSRKKLTRYLSGGNIQKVIIAREFSKNPKFILADQPTRGLDVGAIEYVWQKLFDLRQEGKGILLLSEDLDEIFQLSDRIAVIYKGRLMGIALTSELSRNQIGLMMTGSSIEECC